MKIHLSARERFIENGFKFVTLLRARQAAGFRVVDKKRVQNDVVRSRENLRGQNIEARRAKRARDLAEQSCPIPGANLYRITGSIGFVVPINYRRQRILIFRNQQPHETVGQKEVVQDSFRGVNLKIASW